MQKTRTVSKNDQVEKWYVIDATGKRIGRVATRAAEVLLGKEDVQTRDYLLPKHKVVIVNASKLDVPARKAEGKVYTRYSGYPSGLRKDTLGEMMAKFPERVLEHAIKGMLPKNRRGKAIAATNLYVYSGAEHLHEAQKPEVISNI